MTESHGERRTDADGLVCHLDRPLPASLVVGRGTVLYLTGRCYHPTRDVRALTILVDDVPHPVANHSRLRPDVPSDDPAIGDTVPNSLTSGFWAAVPLAPVSAERIVRLACRATLVDGGVRSATLGTLRLEPAPAARHDAIVGGSDQTRVAICMATHDPDPVFFAAQIASIIGQQHQNWVCIVCDDASAPDRLDMIAETAAGDPRFRLVRNAVRAGHYGNFERALGHVPSDAAFVALADQDDVWYPDKLTSLLAACGPRTTLAYADVDVVAPDGSPIAGTYWTTRRNNSTDLASLVFCNTVTGAASLFRATLLDDVLPFPPRIGDAYHDHWIACAALAAGEIAYVDRALHAYRQHEGNVLGHHVPATVRRPWSVRAAFRALAIGDGRRRLMAALWRRREVYGNDVVRLIVLARTLLLRLAGRVTAAKQRALERVAALETAPLGLVRETVAALAEGRPTLGAEWHCLRGTLAARALDLHYTRNRVRLFEQRVVGRELTGGGSVSPTAGLDLIEAKIAPLRLDVRADAPRRVNLIVPAIDFAHLFAGYLGKLHLALRLADAGQAVRMVIVDPCDHDRAAWRRAIARYPGLESLFDRIEVAYAAERSVPLPVHPRDAFVATTWWTAHVAHAAVQALGAERFVYLIQEFEPMTFPMGSLAALAAESYELPHVALFSTTFLRDYFRDRRLGVFAAGEAPAFTFANAIATFEVTAERLARSGPRRLLFYARPEQHAARNMFEIGVLALRRAVADGMLAPEAWIVEGIGAGRSFAPVPLGREQYLTLLPRVSLAEYRAALPRYDAGLALMLTPHPSLVPLEMAAAGLLTVTNTYANKTAAALRAIAGNLLPVAPTIAGVRDGLAEAVAAAADVERRVAGSRVAWSTDWRESFDDGLLAALGRWLGDPPGAVRA